MSDDETTELIRLRRQQGELRGNLSDAHDQIADVTYKYGYVLAMLGIPADLPLEEVKKQVARLKTRHERAMQINEDERGYTRDELIAWLDDDTAWKKS